MLAVVLSFLVACEPGNPKSDVVKAPEKPVEAEKVVVYSGRSESLVGDLFTKMENIIVLGSLTAPVIEA